MKHWWLPLIIACLAAPAGASDQVYSWTDANGVTHYSDSPPPANTAGAKRLNLRGGVTSSSNQEEAQPAEEGGKKDGPAMAAAAGYTPADIERNCEVSRRNLQVLMQGKPPVNENGDPVDADAMKSYNEQVGKAEQEIKLFCG